MKKIDFVFIGPQRTGTSWIDVTLRNHDSLCLPYGVKETMYFDHDHDELDTYWQYFSKAKNFQLLGEVAPTYFDSKKACNRIHDLNPDCKIIVTIRNPVDRAFSLYCHHLAKGRVSKSFLEAVNENPRILESGKYSEWLPLWEKTFGKENIYLIKIEDIDLNPQKTIDEVLDFLGVHHMRLPAISQQPIGQATLPRFKLLAKIMSKLVIFFRKRRWHLIPEIGKKIGLKKVFKGAEDALPKMTREEHEFLKEYFDRDLQYLNLIYEKKA